MLFKLPVSLVLVSSSQMAFLPLTLLTYYGSLFSRALFLFYTLHFARHPPVVFCSPYSELEGKSLTFPPLKGVLTVRLHMPCFTNHTTPLDHFISNGPHRSLAVCWFGCYFLYLKSKAALEGGCYFCLLTQLYLIPQALIPGRSTTSLHSQGTVFPTTPLAFQRKYGALHVVLLQWEHYWFSHSFLFPK